jgi:thiamine biosynthesis lipoprotein
MISYNFEAIGTKWNIDVEDTEHEEHSILKKIKDRIEVFDRTYSRFRSDSLITKMSGHAGEYILPDDAEPLFSLYKKIYSITEGSVTPLIGNVLSDAGYDAEYSLRPKPLHKPDSWDKVLEYKHPKLTMKKPALLDFGAAGKGYLIDIIGEILEQNGIESYCIDGSGDLLYKNETNKPMRIGLEHPENPKQAIGVATITEGSLCASAGNRRKWGNFHHIINPHTLTSPTDILSIWTIAEDAILADALTTCLFFAKPAKLEKYFRFEYAILAADYTITKSNNFPGEFFYS